MYLWSDYLFNMYSYDYEFIDCDFTAISEEVEFGGVARIKRGRWDVEVKGNIADCKIISENVITIKATDTPQYCELTLFNLPKKHLKNDVEGEIIIKLSKTRVQSTLQISIDYNGTAFEGEIQPLIDGDQKIMEVIII